MVGRQEIDLMLRAVLVTSKHGIPLKRLTQEYSQVTGDDFLLQKLGGMTLEEYLISIPNVVTLRDGCNKELVCHAADSEEMSHILKLVAQQKSPKHKKPRLHKYCQESSQHSNAVQSKPEAKRMPVQVKGNKVRRIHGKERVAAGSIVAPTRKSRNNTRREVHPRSSFKRGTHSRRYWERNYYQEQRIFPGKYMRTIKNERLREWRNYGGTYSDIDGNVKIAWPYLPQARWFPALLCWRQSTRNVYFHINSNSLISALRNISNTLQYMLGPCVPSSCNSLFPIDFPSFCAVHICGRWFRGWVDLTFDNKLLAGLVDYGCQGYVERYQLAPLPRECTLLPAQAVSCWIRSPVIMTGFPSNVPVQQFCYNCPINVFVRQETVEKWSAMICFRNDFCIHVEIGLFLEHIEEWSTRLSSEHLTSLEALIGWQAIPALGYF
uniref:HTH OST-type domain-containing protein n=1 Tax=Eptatretus burgeri TaxID=7764 RepID=A0A8C4QVL0_EPTBU